MKGKLFLSFLLFILFNSCSNEVDKRISKGKIQLKTRIIYDASKGYSNNVVVDLSTLYFFEDNIMEFVPNEFDSSITDSINLIKNEFYYNMKVKDEEDVNNFEYNNITFRLSIYDKKSGAVFLKDNDTIYGFENRIELADTTIQNLEYKRFKIQDKIQVSHFWFLKTDSILPYSLSPYTDNFYNSRLVRIDSYKAMDDIFQTLILDYSKDVPLGVLERLKQYR